MAYTNSPLVDYVKLSPNYSKGRTHAIDTVTIHCFVGQVTVERGCEVFANPSRKASCNYVVAKDGKIGLVVEEKNRSWCTGGTDSKGKPIYVNGISGAMNDQRAITIEVASDSTAPYAVTPQAMEGLLKLVTDICKRNGIKKLLWEGNKNLVGNVARQNMTVHRWFAQKSCPGDFLYSLHGQIAAEVNKRLLSDTKLGVYVYGGLDYGYVFDPNFYLSVYPALLDQIGTDSQKLFDHFLNVGMKALMIAKADFNIHYYAYYNKDLEEAFGVLSPENVDRYYCHYLTVGHNEPRRTC